MGRYDLFIFQKTEKNRVLNIHSIAYAYCSADHLFSVSYVYGFFLGYFRKLWRICDLVYIISPWRIAHVSYRLKSLTNWGFAVGSNQNFVEEVLLSYLWLLRLKSKLQFCKKIIHVICKVNVCYFWSFRLWIRI